MKPQTSCTSTACACARACCRSASRSSESPPGWRCCSPRRSRLQSLSSSVAQLSHGIVGNATLQLIARDAQGFEAGLAPPGARACPACAPRRRCWKRQRQRHRASRAANRSSSSALTRASPRLGGSLVRHTQLSPFAGIEAIVLPAPLAHKLGSPSSARKPPSSWTGASRRRRCTSSSARGRSGRSSQARSRSPRSRPPRK